MAYILNATFNPLTYDLIVKPLLQATDLQNLYEDAYMATAILAADIAARLNKETDAKALEQYLNYYNDLMASVELLTRTGLSPSSRQALNKMRVRYSLEMAPIEIAYKERLEDIKRLKDISDRTGGRTVFSRTARTTSLDDYMKGIDDYQLANLDNVFNEGATGAKAITSRYFSTLEGKLFQGDYLNLITKEGLSPDEAMLALRSAKDKNGNYLYPDLEDYIQKGLSKYSAFSGTPEGLAIHDSFMQGINAGIVYKKDNKPMEDWRTKMEAQTAKELDILREKYNIEHPTPLPTLDLFSGLNHLTGNLDAGGKDYSKFLEVRKIISTDGLSLSQDYVGANFTNPLAIYEEAQEAYSKAFNEYLKNPNKSKSKMSGRLLMALGDYENYGEIEEATKKAEAALKEVLKKYGVTSRLSKLQYEGLKELGYTSNSTYDELTATNIHTKINELVLSYRPTSVSLKNYLLVSPIIGTTLSGFENSGNFKGLVYEYNNGKKGSSLKASDVIDLTNPNKTNITIVAYSAQEPDLILMNINGKFRYVDPTIISAEVKNMINNYSQLILQSKTVAQKSYWQDAAADDLEKLMLNYYKVSEGN